MENFNSLADSGTFDLAGSLRKPQFQHIDTFAGEINRS
jgi:hypothetical protein